MGFNVGIVGLPNVGKSTLFNALTQTQSAESANYPFCTIEPNTGRVGVPDDRLHKLAELNNSEKVIANQLEFVDIAGLVKGASKGEGLGNQFLANIRETDAIAHVLRCFENGDITHVEGSVDPLRDAEIIETELMIADMENLEKRIANMGKRAKSGDKDAAKELALIEKALATLNNGLPARKTEITEDEEKMFKSLALLTGKPLLYVCNVDEESASTGNSLSAKVQEKADAEGAQCVIISANIEEEVAQLDEEERQMFLSELGLTESGLSRVIKAGYKLLSRITFFTVGPKEARAWDVKVGSTAPNAAGVIHGDFERGFICAETIAYDDYIECGTETKAKELGKMRQEGKSYIVQDGDVFHFRFNV
ncbi:MAG: redox-regulated ATPase YchF [Alphaproteobacteria bacterium]